MKTMNQQRAAWAHTAVTAFRQVCDTDDSAELDLIVSLCHLMHQRGRNVTAEVERALRNFSSEVACPDD